MKAQQVLGLGSQFPEASPKWVGCSIINRGEPESSWPALYDVLTGCIFLGLGSAQVMLPRGIVPATWGN